mgnify:CR=1 FL=1
MKKFTSGLSKDHKKYIFDICKKYKSFDKFINNFIIFKIKIFKNNKEELIELIKKLKSKQIKKLGYNIIKKLSKKDNALEEIKLQYNKLENSMTKYNELIYKLNNLNNNILKNILNYDSNKKIYEINFIAKYCNT